MDTDTFEALEESNQRIAHACQLCREKRVRCSGERPACSRCQQQRSNCVYGYARGDSRKSLLAAIEEHNARSDQTTLSADTSSIERSSRIKLEVKTEKHVSNDVDLADGDNDEDDDDDDDAAASQGSVDAESSLQSPQLPQSEESVSETTSGASSGRRFARKQQRRSRISSACLECKKRRRKCTGGAPCQTCVAFQTDCVYDRTQDRRSKAYFQKKLNDGVREALNSDNIEDVLKLIKQNDQYDQIASELRAALQNAEKSKQVTDRNSSPMTQHERSLICKYYCALDGSRKIPVQWVSLDLQARQESLLNGPDHLILPYIVPDDSPLSRAFSNFHDAATHMRSQGTPLAAILGPLDPEVDLLFRPRRSDDPFTAGTWACELARIYEGIDVFTLLANAFLLSRFMRWIIDPSVENFILLPDIMKPTHSQRVIPHFASADLYSIPAIRDSLIHGNLHLTATIGTIRGKGLRFDWPFDLGQAVDRSPSHASSEGVRGTAKVSRLFAACASDPKYWSCDMDFLGGFPEAAGHLNVITHQHDWNQ